MARIWQKNKQMFSAFLLNISLCRILAGWITSDIWRREILRKMTQLDKRRRIPMYYVIWLVMMKIQKIFLH